MHKGFLIIASVLGALSVTLGAFGAHALKKVVPPESVASFETGAVAGAHDLFAGIGDEHEFAFDDIDKFVLVRVPMPLARPDAGIERDDVGAELSKARCVAEAEPTPVLARLVVRRRIARALAFRRCV